VRFEESAYGDEVRDEYTVGGYAAFSKVCTHAGCMVADRDGDVLVCPCHSGRFDPVTGGQVVGGRRHERSRSCRSRSRATGTSSRPGTPGADRPRRRMMSRIDAAVDRAESAYDWVDSRLDLDDANDFLGKAFPAEDSFLLGEVALFCFGILVSTGTFLAFFYEPSTAAVEYGGSVAQYQGQEMPAAFKSVLNITYDVPFGMFLRRMHHWAAHLFVASIALHMLRVFFTGAYRNPREPNWLVGTGLAGLAMFAAYTGYSLPYDEFASTAVGIGYNVAASIPIVGDPLASIVFGGQFPTSATIPRLFFLHVFLIPAAIAGLIAVHMAILVRQKHTEAQRDEDVAAAGGGGGTAKTGGSAEATDGGARLIDRDDDSVVIGSPRFRTKPR